MNDTPHVLSVTGLSAGYGARLVLRDISMQIEAAQIVALIGANGAGKTTLLRALMGLIDSSTGTLCIDGQLHTQTSTRARVQAGMTLSPEGRLLCPELSVAENILLGAYARRLSRREQAARLDELFGLFDALKARRESAAGLLSGGEQQMVAMARALMASPKLLLLDEPTLGLSPQRAEQIFSIVRALQANGTAVLMAEQQAGAALQVAARGYVLVAGEITQQGPATQLAADVAVQRAFLGGA